ncbi:25747_t:CDS:2, partial [Gigaspora rosea]
CSTTNLGKEVKRYIKDCGAIKFQRPVIFDEFNEFRSAVDILNNLQANSFSAYCQFVPGTQQMKYVDFRKKLSKSILTYYSDSNTTDLPKKRQKLDSTNFEHHLSHLSNHTRTRRKGKYVQRRCLDCHNRTTTCCSCEISRGMCTFCWALHI